MTEKLMDAKKVSQSILDKAREDADEAIKNGRQPVLAIVRAGEDPGSVSYEKSIIKRMAASHINVYSVALPADATEENLLAVVDELNHDENVHAILLFMPLPEGVDEKRVKAAVAPEKDVDSLNPASLGKMMAGEEDGFVPCTAEGVMEILDAYDVPLKGKEVVVVNNSNVLGKPLSLLLTNEFATVTLCHIFTEDLKSHTKDADIVVTAAGQYGLITPDMLKDDAVLVDVAMSQKKDENGEYVLNEEGKKIRTGDAREDVIDKVRLVTSATPGLGGGTGPVTTALLAKNVMKAFKNQESKK